MMQKYQDSSFSPEERASDLLARMDLDEKFGQIQCYNAIDSFLGKSVEKQNPYGVGQVCILIATMLDDVGSAAGLIARLQKQIMESGKHHIPAIFHIEALTGVMVTAATSFPCGLGQASTWDPEQQQKMAACIARQGRAMGISHALAPVFDICRDPRFGRMGETYGEDPTLAAAMGTAYVKGLQDKHRMSACSKHFLGFMAGQGGIHTAQAVASPRELREVYAKPFQAAITDGKLDSVMNSYAAIDGQVPAGSKAILRDLLRGEMGFDGIVMADGLAVDFLKNTEGDTLHAGVAARKAGVDVSLWDEAFSRLGEAVEQGLLDESEIDESVLKVLKLKFEKGLFEHPYMEENMLTPEEAGIPEVSLSLARESAVLLKNEESVLPLAKKYKKVAVIGYHAADRYCMLGDYTPPVPESECVTVLQGMKQEAPEGVEVSYAMGSEFSEADEDEKAKALALAAKSDVIVAVVGGSSSRFGGAVFDANGAASKGTGSRSMDCGEGMDTAKVHIPAAQEELVAELARLGKPMVTVVIAGRAYCIEDIENASNALLYAFYPGPMGGKAVAEMLYGTTNPSGRLPVSMPRHAGQIPVCYNYRTSVVPAYCDMTSQPLHTFGEGKSYTTFACSDVSVNKEENGAAVSFTVENTGAMAGTSVPCLYVRKRSGGVVARIKELKAFTRISLAPGEKKEVSFQLSKEEMNFVQIPGKPEVICHDYELMLEDGAEKWWSGNVTEM